MRRFRASLAWRNSLRKHFLKPSAVSVAQELWIARKMLSREGRLPKTGANAPVRTWDAYCQDIGSTRSTVNRWLAAVE
jgi:hypothetical protein